MVADKNISLQMAILQAFNYKCLVIDNKDMTLTLNLSASFDIEKFKLIKYFGLIPKPQGVRYTALIISDPNDFGFAEAVPMF